jgi:hypothetical protein
MRAPQPEQIQHARTLIAKGWQPLERMDPYDLLATVRLHDTLLNVERETWAVMHLMQPLPIRGEVKAGNPKIRLTTPAPAVDRPSDNGVLTRVRGSFVAEACAKLKPAREAVQDEQARVALGVPDVGLVEFTFKANTYRHGRSRHWHWIAVRADLVQP